MPPFGKDVFTSLLLYFFTYLYGLAQYVFQFPQLACTPGLWANVYAVYFLYPGCNFPAFGF
jgi:hypothetical protein